MFRNSYYIYNPSKPPFEKGGLWQVSHLLTYGEHILSTLCSRSAERSSSPECVALIVK